MHAKKPVLGRGLDALFGSLSPGTLTQAVSSPVHDSTDSAEVVAEAARSMREVPIERIAPNPFQPRTVFDAEKLSELAASIKEKGILQPLIVRGGPETYQIVAGERRWRAAQQAGLREVPVVVNDFSDREMTEAAIIENIQRDDLNPIDEAHGYETLATEFGLTQEAIAQTVGKSRVAITNALRLLRLPEEIIEMIRRDQLSAGHARAILGLQSLENQLRLAKRVIDSGLSVRETERLSKQSQSPPSNGAGSKDNSIAPAPRSIDAADMEEKLSLHLGMRVRIHRKSNASGRVEVLYSSLDEFQRFCETLGLKLTDL